MRCAASRSRRRARGFAGLRSPASAGTFGGGAGAGVPSTFSSTHLPRSTGDVRFGYDVIVRMLAWPSRPRRFGSVTGTLRNWLPYTPSMP